MSDSSSGQTPPPESLIDYPGLVDRALRQVVRLALEQADGGELPGQHYFYISFSTRYLGVVIDDDLRAGHPETLSIVLQYQFENLVVGSDHFEVTLYFGGDAKHLSVPYDAVLGFVDPYISFALQFPPLDEEEDDEEMQDLADGSQARPSYLRALSDEDPPEAAGPAETPAPSEAAGAPTPLEAKRAPKPASKGKKAGAASTAKKTSAKAARDAASGNAASGNAASGNAASGNAGRSNADAGQEPPETAEQTADDGSNVVSLDQFRKK